VTALAPNTTYFIRAYAVNTYGTGYGEELSFTTLPLSVPTLTTSPATDISYHIATSGGNISLDGGDPVSVRGVCWGMVPGPTIAQPHTSDGSGSGSFTSSITGLNAGTYYYVGAYATSSLGTGYGNELTFTTDAVGKPTVITLPITDSSYRAATGGGEVVYDSGETVTSRGVCWSVTPNPTVANID
ncbi:MAG: hypothetical protein WCL29_02055, partial [Pseudomonadota bacterium]